MTLWIALGAAGLLAALFFFRKPHAPKGPVAKPATDALLRGLDRSRTAWLQQLGALLKTGSVIDEALYEKMEESLVTADVGIRTTHSLLEKVRQSAGRKNLQDAARLREVLKEEVLAVLKDSAQATLPLAVNPQVILVAGVNGVGKTTTIGKLAAYYTRLGKRVMLAAGDTFRAAAVEQLKIWGERTGAEVISQGQGGSPAAVAFDAAQAAVSRKAEVLIVDTAGRLQTKENLMEELKKVCRVLEKQVPGAPHEIFLVLDATTGQNALEQARKFKADLGRVTGIVLTKLDGTAKGGILIALCAELGIPVRFIGVGEGLDDLRPFEAETFVEALFSGAAA